jgi:hypothetical protein
MSESVREMLAREATEAEALADAEDRGEVNPKSGQRARQPSEASQVYSLRLPSAAIAQLRQIAEKNAEPPTALLRRFVLERLAHECRVQQPADAVAAVVDDLMPLVRQRLLEAAHEVRTRPGDELLSRGEQVVRGVNLGPSRRSGPRTPRTAEISA